MNVEYSIDSSVNLFAYICSFLSVCSFTFLKELDGASFYRDPTDCYTIVVRRDLVDTDVDGVFLGVCDSDASSGNWYSQTGTICANHINSGTYVLFFLPFIRGILYGNFCDNIVCFSLVDESLIHKTFIYFCGIPHPMVDTVVDQVLVGGTVLYLYNEFIVDEDATDNWKGKLSLPEYEITADADGNRVLFSDDVGHRLYIGLRVDVDDAYLPSRGQTRWAMNYPFTKVSLGTSFSNYYNAKSVPNYSVLLPNEVLSSGYTSALVPSLDYNQMNGITLCLPLFLYIIRDPQILHTYSITAYTNVINLVDMYDIHSGFKLDSSYPVEKTQYQCFAIYSRRQSPKIISKDRYSGFIGIAIKQEEDI